MKKFFGSMTLLAATVLFVSCDKDIVRGHGNSTTVTRTVPAFTSVDITGNRTAEYIYATESKVELTGYENLISIYEAKVENNKLHFEYPHHQVVKNDNIRLKIYGPNITKTNLTGNVDVKLEDGLNAPEFEAQLSGNGKLRFSNNQFDKLIVHSSGNAVVLAQSAVSKMVDIDMSGNANMEVKATQKLKVRLSGSGTVHYWGDPAETDIVISGTGKVIKH